VEAAFLLNGPAEANDPEWWTCLQKEAVRVEVKSPTGPQLDMVTIMPMIKPAAYARSHHDHSRPV